MDTFNFDLMVSSLPLLAKGAALSLEILLFAALLSLTLGTLFGVLTCNRLRLCYVATAVEMVTFVLRAVPFYVQLLIVYFVIPDLLRIDLDSFVASIVALGCCSSGYVAQIVRSGINSVPIEQWESAETLGFSTIHSLRFVIFGQMIRSVLPVLTNELESLLKTTSILSSIGLVELTRMGMNIVSREMAPLTIYLSIAAFYAAISFAIIITSRYLERRLKLC